MRIGASLTEGSEGLTRAGGEMFERLEWQAGDHLRQAKGGKVLAVPAFMAATTMMFAKSSSSVDLGQTLACAVQPDARKAS